METDPEEPGYRYPSPGERLWHAPWGCWVIVQVVTPEERVHVVPLDEVFVRFEGNRQGAIVKLRSLEENPRFA